MCIYIYTYIYIYIYRERERQRDVYRYIVCYIRSDKSDNTWHIHEIET